MEQADKDCDHNRVPPHPTVPRPELKRPEEVRKVHAKEGDHGKYPWKKANENVCKSEVSDEHESPQVLLFIIGLQSRKTC